MNNRIRQQSAIAFVLLCASSFAAALPSAVAAASPQSLEPQTMSGSTNYASAPAIQFNSVGGFYGVFNSSSGQVEPIRGRLAYPAGPSTHYYKIDLQKGKVLKAVLTTETPAYFLDGNNVQRITPNFQLFVYAGIPSFSTLIDWNTDGIIGGFTTNSDLASQEVNILTPIGGGTPATYYLNVSCWYGSGFYSLNVTVTDPVDLPGGVNDRTATLVTESDDTHWYRIHANHVTAVQNFEEVSGYVTINNWNTNNPYQVDALIRVFAEDLGYSPDDPIGRPIEKSEAPNRQTEPISVLAPYTGYYYIMLRQTNYTNVQYTLHTEVSSIPRFPSGGLNNIHKERFVDDTDWYWFNMTKASGAGQNDRVIFNMSETSDDQLAPVNLNLWLFGYRDYFLPHGAGSVNDFDLLNSSFQGDAPYNLSLNPEPRYEEVAAQAMYTGIYFLEVEDYNNSGNYSVGMRFDTAPHPPADFNNEPSQAETIQWGLLKDVTIDQAEDHTDFYKISARAGETLEVYYEMPNRNAPDGRFTNQTVGLAWVGIYQAGMTPLAQGWNYWFDFLNSTDHLESYIRVSTTVAVDGDYIIEVSALEDGYIGPYTLPNTMPPRTIQVFWHMDWTFTTKYNLYVSRLPGFNAFPEAPFIKQLLPDLTINEDEPANGVFNLTDYFDDPDLIQGDRLNYTFSQSGPKNMNITVVNGLVSVEPWRNWSGTNLFQVSAKDQTGSTAKLNWNVTVLPINDAPYLVTSLPIRFLEDSGVHTFDLGDYVRDVDGDPLVFTQLPDSNVTLTFTGTSIRIVTVPDFQTTSLGADYPVYFDVNDQTTTVRMAIYLNVTNALDAPRALVGPQSITCDEDAPCTTIDLYTVFYDPDDPLRNAPLNFLVSGNGEVSYNVSAGRTLVLTPPLDWSGAKSMQMQAIKFVGGQPYSSETVDLSLFVREINDPPRISTATPQPPVTLQEGTPRSFSVEASDPEHLSLTFDWYLDGVNLQNTLSTYTYSPSFEVATGLAPSKAVSLRVVANDSQGGVAEYEWQITVVDVPRPPVVSISAPREGNVGYQVGKELQFFASAFDPDGDVMTYSWKDSAGQELLDKATGTYTFNEPGTRKITLTVSDGVLSVSTSVNVTVGPNTDTGGFRIPGFDAPSLIGALGAACVVAVLARRRRRE